MQTDIPTVASSINPVTPVCIPFTPSLNNTCRGGDGRILEVTANLCPSVESEVDSSDDDADMRKTTTGKDDHNLHYVLDTENGMFSMVIVIFFISNMSQYMSPPPVYFVLYLLAYSGCIQP